MESEKENCCLFYRNKFEEKPTVIYSKGLGNIRRIAKKNHDFEQQEEIQKKSRTGEAILVHADCRKRFTDKRKNVDSQPTNSKRLKTKLMCKTLCFFCEITINKDYKSSKEFSRVMTLEVKERVLKRASERDDEWGKTVESRLLSSNDLVAEEAIYHKACMGKFCLSKTSVYEKRGRPVNTEMFNGFEAICAWLEEDDDCNLHTINELQEQIKLMGYECYSKKRLK